MGFAALNKIFMLHHLDFFKFSCLQYEYDLICSMHFYFTLYTFLYKWSTSHVSDVFLRPVGYFVRAHIRGSSVVMCGI
jgi:hypothetical protein